MVGVWGCFVLPMRSGLVEVGWIRSAVCIVCIVFYGLFIMLFWGGLLVFIFASIFGLW